MAKAIVRIFFGRWSLKVSELIDLNDFSATFLLLHLEFSVPPQMIDPASLLPELSTERKARVDRAQVRFTPLSEKFFGVIDKHGPKEEY